MEHKLIEGGAHYLPLARSEIKRLRATGQLYATKRLVFPDATVTVRIEPNEHDHIHITGNGLSIAMDSGVVDVRSIAPTNANSYLTGILYETSYAAAYNGGFLLPESGNPPRVKASSGSAGQFAGTISYASGAFKGRVPIDGERAQSFAPAKIPDGATPPNLVDEPQDAVMFEKKRTAVLCPASMFTGRCRMYVQALYGAHLAKGATRPTPFELVDISTQRPALMLNNRTTGGQRVLLHTGSGVHLDETTGRHWLFDFASGGTAYPLKGPANVEALRKHLIAADNPLSAQDREHLEAYILSQCLPVGDGNDADDQPYMTGSASNPYSMGYSWHWNWDGLVADAVTSETYSQGGLFEGMLTTHRRVTITKVDGQWNAVETVVEGPVQWAVPRAQWTITEPDYFSYTALKSTPKFSSIVPGNAPIYAFYLRNELQTCRVNITLNGAVTAGTRTQTDTYTTANTYLGAYEPRRTYGDETGYLIDEHPAPAYHSATFSAGTVTVGPLDYNRTSSRNRHTITNKTPSGAVWTSGFGGSTGYTGQTFYYSPTPNPNRQTFNYYLFGNVDNEGQNWIVTYDELSGTELTTYDSRATIVVPFYDAEAIYLEGANTRRDSWTRLAERWDRYVGSSWKFKTTVTPTGGSQIELIRDDWFGAGRVDSNLQNLISSATTVEVTESVTVQVSKMLGHAGVLDATFSNLSEFHDNSVDNVGAPMYTLTSTRGQGESAAIATGVISPVGTNGASPAAPVIVGWT